MKVLNDEREIITEINQLYKDDRELAKTLKESENEIRESEEMFNKARAAIEATLKESEKQMQEYELKLEELYKARQLALKAKEDLYHPWDKWSTSDSSKNNKVIQISFIKNNIYCTWRSCSIKTKSSIQANQETDPTKWSK